MLFKEFFELYHFNKAANIVIVDNAHYVVTTVNALSIVNKMFDENEKLKCYDTSRNCLHFVDNDFYNILMNCNVLHFRIDSKNKMVVFTNIKSKYNRNI